jgi:mannitol-1-/sugar-/sorbitol-6-phosphatase
MQAFRCRAVIFDLDGVLVDSTRSVERQWRLWAREHAVDPEQILEIAHGRRTVEVIRLLAPHLELEAEVRRVEQREADDTNGVDVMPGAAALIAAIPESRWAVVTSGTTHLATSRLRHAKLPIPKVLVSADQVKEGKPHPEPYLMGAHLLNMPATECLVIEDAPAGIEAAHAAGMKAIGLTSTFSAGELSADCVVQDLRDLQVVIHNGVLELQLLK